jgi:hypothetical protein
MKKIFALFVAVAALMVWTIPATAAGVDFGGQYRVRGESKSETDFYEGDGDHAVNDQSAYYGQRVRLWGVAKPTNDTTVKITIQDTRTWGRNSSIDGPGLTNAASGNNLDLHESYVLIDEFFGTPLSLKVGRQELVYGDQRLVGSFGWSNNGRSFDAAKTMYRSDQVDVDFVASKITDVAGKDDNDSDFYILYSTVKTIPNNSLDLYLMLLRDGGATPIIGTNTVLANADESQSLWTYGLRLKGAAAGVDYTAEFAFQTGEINTAGTDYDLDANAYAIRVGYTIPGAPMGIRVGVEYAYASGDDDATDNDLETFTNLFPTNHGHYGNADVQGWRNIEAWNINASAKVNAKTSVKISYWDFTLAEEDDSWYSAGDWNSAVTASDARTACSTCDDEVGQELDLSIKYKYNSAVTLMAGVSRFFAGDHLKDAATGVNSEEDMDYAWLQLTANF